MSRSLDIHHSNTGEYYEMYIDGKFIGNYDTVNEAVQDYEELKKAEAEKASA